MGNDRISQILVDLYSDDRDRRSRADEELNAMISSGISVEDACRLIRAAAKKDQYEDDWYYNAQYHIISAFRDAAGEECISSFLEVFPNLMHDAKIAVLQTLAAMKTKKGAEAFMEVLRRHVRSGELRDLSRAAMTLEEEPIYPDIFFPEILNYAIAPDLSWVICDMAVHYINAGKLDPGSLVSHGPRILTAYNEYRRRLLALKEKVKMGVADREEYTQDSARADAILELLGHIPGNAAEKVLREASSSHDAQSMLWATVSLLRLGKDVDPRLIEEVASNAETRNTLYEQLQQLRKTKLYPKKYRNQVAFAESEMVRWLSFPTELGRAPDEIRLAKVLSEDVGGHNGILDVYLFMFRCDSDPWKEKGWMAGVAGAYRRKEEPTTNSTGWTFSELEPWDRKTPEQHVNDALQYIADLSALTVKKAKQA